MDQLQKFSRKQKPGIIEIELIKLYESFYSAVNLRQIPIFLHPTNVLPIAKVLDMPIRLEQIRQPTPEDWADLEKIHKDTQSEGLTLSQESIQGWLDEGGMILGGRFNDRLVGIALAKDQQEESVLLLTQAAVRAVTQGRGVMHQLIELTKIWAKENQRSILIPQVPKHLHPALENRSFQAADGAWHYTP